MNEKLVFYNLNSFSWLTSACYLVRLDKKFFRVVSKDLGGRWLSPLPLRKIGPGPYVYGNNVTTITHLSPSLLTNDLIV